MKTQLACDIYCLLVRSRSCNNSRGLSDKGLPQGKQKNKLFFSFGFSCVQSVSRPPVICTRHLFILSWPRAVCWMPLASVLPSLCRLKSFLWKVNVKVRMGVVFMVHSIVICIKRKSFRLQRRVNPYPTAFPYGNGMVLHFYQQQQSSTTKTVHKVINKGLKTYV